MATREDFRITFRVEGDPAPGGSKKSFFSAKTRTTIITDDARGNARWRNLVRKAARKAMRESGEVILTGPVVVLMQFFLQRPKSHLSKAKGRDGEVLDKYVLAKHTTKPDLLKLARSTEDAMTGVVWVDDAQVVGMWLHKWYCADGQKPGVSITIGPA